jgi:hypothetical protein
MKKTGAVFILLLFSAAVYAQQYIIQYDMATENLRYLKIKRPGDTASTAIIDMNKAKRVNLQLLNTAGSFRQEIILHEKDEPAETILIPGLGSAATPEGLAGIIAKSETNNLDAEKVMGKMIANNDNKAFNMESVSQKMALQQFVMNYNNFKTAFDNWKKAVLMEQEYKRLWKDMATIRYNLGVTADHAKATARKNMQAVFPGTDENTATAALMNTVNDPAAMALAVQNNYNKLQDVYTSFPSIGLRSPAADSLINEAGNLLLLPAAANRGSTINTGDIISRTTDLYRQILADKYIRLTPLNISSKTIMAEIQFIPEIDSVTGAVINMKIKDTAIRWISVYKKQPLRFKNTFGFSFVSYAENRWKYYVRPDSVIARESADQFQPVVVTYLHFYSPRDRGFRWGGSFGAGFPASGENKQLNIMLGLSTFLGKGDPVCISAGVSGTQVKKLSAVQLGDKVSSADYNIQYNNVYRAGYFISLTFNPSALNKKD